MTVRAQFMLDLDEAGHRSRVWLNGEDISGQLNGIEISSHVGELTNVRLSFPAALVDGDVCIKPRVFHLDREQREWMVTDRFGTRPVLLAKRVKA